jgi:hypothetical protein
MVYYPVQVPCSKMVYHPVQVPCSKMVHHPAQVPCFKMVYHPVCRCPVLKWFTTLCRCLVIKWFTTLCRCPVLTQTEKVANRPAERTAVRACPKAARGRTEPVRGYPRGAFISTSSGARSSSRRTSSGSRIHMRCSSTAIRRSAPKLSITRRHVIFYLCYFVLVMIVDVRVAQTKSVKRFSNFLEVITRERTVFQIHIYGFGSGSKLRSLMTKFRKSYS